MGHNFFIFGFCVQFSGMLFEGNWFDWFYFLHIEGLALIIEFLILGEWLSKSSLIVETDFLGVLVGLCLNPSGGVLSTAPDLHFQITYHLNDHYYISKLNYINIIKSLLSHTKSSGHHGNCQTYQYQNKLPEMQKIGIAWRWEYESGVFVEELSGEYYWLLCLFRGWA